MDSKATPDPVLQQIRTPLRLTVLGLWAEALVWAFWPAYALILLVAAAVLFGLPNHLPLDLAWGAALGVLAALGGALWYAARRFRRPNLALALARLDAGSAGQPLAALRDGQAIGTDDPAAVALWQVHRARMAQRLGAIRPAPPNLRLSAADPFALRYGALLLALMALFFGGPMSLGGLGPMGGGVATPNGPMWEAWATPPAYTGKPALYLADHPEDTPLTLPMGTRIDLRLYGTAGDVILDETISARTDATEIAQQSQSFAVAQSGKLRFVQQGWGQGARDFEIVALPDAPPSISAAGTLGRDGDARFALPFAARDDYGITKGAAQIVLDLPRVARSYGLAAEPDSLPNAVVDLPLPRRGGRQEVNETLVDDLSKSVLSNMPVTITLQASDGAGNTASSPPISATLPAKRFFDPLAAAIAEMRRDILWARANAPRAAQVLKAVTAAPEGFIRNQRAYLRLRAVIAQLEKAGTTLPEEARLTLAEEMWQLAIMLEEGDLSSARDRLTRAQDRLDEAIRKGAAPEEIAKLMQEMQLALKEYMRQLAQQQRKRGDQTSQNQDQSGPNISQDQLQQLLDRLQQLMEQGKTAEAAELMQRLRDLMDNMQIVEGGGAGPGQGGPGGQAMRDLGDTLRNQQDLSDEAFRDMQQGGGAGDLAQRQQALRDALTQLQRQGTLPGQGTDQGTAGDQALNDAARAMEEAEQALRDGDLPRALDSQAEALQALREGMEQFNQALAEERQQNGQGTDEFGQSTGQEDPRPTDPLGRSPGTALRNGSDANLPQNEEAYRRAEELLEEIRRKSGETLRPEDERNYLRRLLDLF